MLLNLLQLLFNCSLIIVLYLSIIVCTTVIACIADRTKSLWIFQPVLIQPYVWLTLHVQSILDLLEFFFKKMQNLLNSMAIL
jgi:hypothetical protein